MTEADIAPNGRPEGAPIVDFDLSSHNGLKESNAAWGELRGKCPVAWSDDNGGAWIASSYEVVAEAFRNWEVFRSGRDVRTVPGPGGSPDYNAINAAPTKLSSVLVPEELDPPEWHVYRRLFADLLSPRGAAALEPQIKYRVTKFLDDVIETGRCDFVDDLTNAVPGAVVLEWMGFPEEDWHRLAASFHNMSEYVPGSPTAQHYLDEIEWTVRRINEEVARCRENPRDDVTSLMSNFEIDGERVSFERSVGMVIMTMSGGVDTTTAVASAALVHLHRNPEDRRTLQEHPEMIDRAIEEFLRVYPPARTHGRTVVEDIELGGCQLRKDDRIIISEVSACHDEAAFPDAAKFVIDRFPNRHMAFGLGPHRCPGSHVARLMFKEMLTQVLQRMPDYQLVEEGVKEYPNWTALGGWSALPATFTPGTRRL